MDTTEIDTPAMPQEQSESHLLNLPPEQLESRLLDLPSEQIESRLLNLPPELLDYIWDLALPAQHLIDTEAARDCDKMPGILHVSRQTRSEALPMFYNSTTFILEGADHIGAAYAFKTWLELDQTSASRMRRLTLRAVFETHDLGTLFCHLDVRVGVGMTIRMTEDEEGLADEVVSGDGAEWCEKAGRGLVWWVGDKFGGSLRALSGSEWVEVVKFFYDTFWGL